MKNFLSKYAGYNVSHSNSYVATAFAVVVTSLLVGGYEVTQTVNDTEVSAAVAHPEAVTQSGAVARMETIVVTAKRV
ncbi:MAG: hypothetical protein LH481_10915 [Burkholderiales bacterium]|nr:hypothetical protein [Burkholderiales bacterium]